MKIRYEVILDEPLEVDGDWPLQLPDGGLFRIKMENGKAVAFEVEFTGVPSDHFRVEGGVIHLDDTRWTSMRPFFARLKSFIQLGNEEDASQCPDPDALTWYNEHCFRGWGTAADGHSTCPSSLRWLGRCSRPRPRFPGPRDGRSAASCVHCCGRAVGIRPAPVPRSSPRGSPTYGAGREGGHPRSLLPGGPDTIGRG